VAVHGELLAKFQSTRPMRGATWLREVEDAKGMNFNPRAPCGARRVHSSCGWAGRQHFNPRAPCGARRALSESPLWYIRISIHAPHAGRDAFLAWLISGGMAYFNPRAPCGARPISNELIIVHEDFNPRAPCGARR